MTIDEAIKFCHEKSENIKLKAEPQVFIDIAEWLELLKWYQQGMEDIPSESGVLPKDVYMAGYIKGIDDFASALSNKDNIVRHDIDELMECSGNFDLACSCLRVYIDDIAEQLKAGETQ